MSYDKVKYNNQYNKQAYDRLNIQVPKGRKTVIDEHWKSKGYRSLNAYINALIEQDMKGEGAVQATSNVQVTANSGIVVGNNSGAIHMGL